ncbi:MAG: HAD family hydrolase [Leptospiraceae bacterium]|nr:HAD family hydrolase [Leptospiraceae bacterium]MCP5495049.1 HAD family hydrolase [Leptospiraceae bacterium]
MKYKGIIFDLDGTLLDSITDIANAMNSVLGYFGYPKHPVSAYKLYVGDGVDILVKRALPQNKNIEKQIIEKCILAYRADYSKRWKENSKLYPGIPELMNIIQKIGIKTAILSNKPNDFTNQIVSNFMPQYKFEMVVGSQAEAPKKPDPTQALKIATHFNLSPSEIVFVGDTDTDMITARNAKMYPIGVLWGFRDASELKASGAKILLKEPRSFLEFIAKDGIYIN